ncbi:hypothetical protein N7456_013273 [Penicillium angulare]|uniref:Cytochrome c oxidase subunit 3 n=1 Tax=Penicillium angulare TaxID=116970 RepID=A0A9W9JV95_9EURO|nr:hypothetical protein N7456_013273 [Penicillium angulare]
MAISHRRISELLKENNNDVPLAVLTAIMLYYILVQVLPTNITDNTVFSRLSNSFTEVYNLKIDNEFVNLLDYKQISYASTTVLFMHGFQGFEYLVPVAVFNVIDVISEGTYIGNHTNAVQKGLNLGVGLFIISEVFFFLAIF